MTAPETPAELRARLRELAATVEDEKRRLTAYRYLDENSQRDRIIGAIAVYYQELVDAWPAIDELLVRLTEAAELLRENHGEWTIENTPKLYRDLWGEP
jgi:hypothetical protein